ncbi:hypothetical protein BS78_K170100 [Paspalum vaginatum]|uniref:Uncharacterized protein n=1 Tax=Paspalum vaginatum TaxID=158149 RepID=A0A9W8CED7_9POAL|nr:hypothetical protein BS78_K170100 [Paspalum vaginatum]
MLIQEELQAVVVGPDDEGAPPQIGAPVTNRLHQPDQLTLVSRELEVAGSERPDEEREGPDALVEDGAKPYAGGIAVDDEGPGKVRHLQHRPCSQGFLERLKGHPCVLIPGERVAAQQPGEGGGDDAEVPYELPVVARKPQEAAEAPRGSRCRPGRHGVHLVSVHGDAIGRDDMAEVGHRGRPK